VFFRYRVSTGQKQALSIPASLLSVMSVNFVRIYIITSSRGKNNLRLVSPMNAVQNVSILGREKQTASPGRLHNTATSTQSWHRVGVLNASKTHTQFQWNEAKVNRWTECNNTPDSRPTVRRFQHATRTRVKVISEVEWPSVAPICYLLTNLYLIF